LVSFQAVGFGARVEGGLEFKAHILLYHSTPSLRVIKKEKKVEGGDVLACLRKARLSRAQRVTPSRCEPWCGRGAARAEDAQGTSTQSHISPSILVYEDKSQPTTSEGIETPQHSRCYSNHFESPEKVSPQTRRR